MIGSQLSHYRIVERLGAGGMGAVFRADDLSLRRQVALKILPEQSAGDASRLQRFRREAELVAALNHPNIVTIHSFEEHDGVHFITMELVEGRPLLELITKGGLPLQTLFAIAVPLVDAVSAAHQKGVVHRDLKPGNVMVTDRGVVKVLDFGLAKLKPESGQGPGAETAVARLTQEGGLLGTVPYMAPEQVRGEEADHRADIFALGVILHEMALGERPFRGSNSADILSAILRDEPQTVTDLREELPFHLGRVVRHCLEKEPEKRFQSALDLRYEMESLSQEVATGQIRPPALPPSSPPPARRPRRPWRWLVPAALAVAIVAAVAWQFGWFWERLPGGSDYDSLAVLPFDNQTGQPAQDYLGDGIALALITRLAEVAELRVSSQAESWGYRDREMSAAQLGKELGVELILEGDVQQSDELLAVNVRLQKPPEGSVLWAKSFAGSRQELLELQREIAASLTRVLDVPLSIRERRRLAKDPTSSFRAYDLYLQGEQFLQSTDARGPDLAAEILRKALELDPDFALAHVGLSEALWTLHQRDRATDALRQAESHAEEALRLDPELPAAQVAMARVLRTTGRLGESIAELRRALASHPAPDEALRQLAFSYKRVGLTAEAEQSLHEAVALAPERWLNWNNLGWFLQERGDYDGAREAFLEAGRRAPPDVTWPRENLAMLKLYEGDAEGALAEFEAIGGQVDDPVLAANLGSASFYSGQFDKAERYYRRAVHLSPGNHEFHWGLGDVLAEKGETDSARSEYRRALALVEDALQTAIEDPELELAWIYYAAKASDCVAALGRLEGLGTAHPSTGANVHRRAQVQALCGRKEKALEQVAEAIRLGEPKDLMRQEVEFRSLREEPEFLRLTAPD